MSIPYGDRSITYLHSFSRIATSSCLSTLPRNAATFKHRLEATKLSCNFGEQSPKRIPPHTVASTLNYWTYPAVATALAKVAIMASTSFRDSMNSLGWSRREPDLPVNTAQQTGLLSSIKSLNPFGDSGYVRLPTVEGSGAPLPARNRREEEEAWFACELESSRYSPLHVSLPLHLPISRAMPDLQH